MRLHHISFGNIKRRKGKMLFLVMGLVIGISTVVTLLSITESMTEAGAHKYQSYQGIPELRDAMAEFYKNYLLFKKCRS